MPLQSAQKIAETNSGIRNRFFEALYILSMRQELPPGDRGFSTHYELNHGSFYRLRKNEHWEIKPIYINWLARDFNVSPTWIIAGKGRMWLDSSITTGPPTSGPVAFKAGQMT